MIEVLKQMYQLLLTEPHAPAVCDQLEVILRQAIAELESQEPLGYIASMALNDMRDGIYGEVRVYHEELGGSVPIYTHPPQRTWVGLTDEEKKSFWTADQMTQEEWDELFNAIENKLKEKNT